MKKIIKGKSVRICLYIDEEIHRKFKEIVSGEPEVSMSQQAEKLFARFVAVHYPGNPQLRLSSFVEGPEKLCFRCEGRFPVLHKVQFISGLIRNVCTVCLEEYQRMTTVKRVMGVT